MGRFDRRVQLKPSKARFSNDEFPDGGHVDEHGIYRSSATVAGHGRS